MGGNDRPDAGGGDGVSFLRRNRTAVVLLAAAALFLVLGVMRGEQEIVFRKAVNICMECIGLG